MIGLYYGGFLEKHCRLIAKYSMQAIIQMLGPENVVVIDRFKGNHLMKIIDQDVRSVKYNPERRESYDMCQDRAEKILRDNGIDKLIVFRNFITSQYRANKYSMAELIEKKMKTGDYAAINFESSNAVAQSYMFVRAASKVCDIVVQFSHDIDEYHFDSLIDFKRYYRTYIASIDGVVFMPTFEIGLQLYGDKTKLDKQLDFVFYCTAKTDDRKYILVSRDKLQGIKNSDVVVVGPKENHTISEEAYDELLRKSKYTMVIPAYNKDNFSIWRIIEATMNNCLCLCHSMNNMHDLRFTYPDICDIVEENLMVSSVEDIEAAMKQLEPNREKLIQQIKSTESFKKITDFDWCQKRWKRMLREE